MKPEHLAEFQKLDKIKSGVDSDALLRQRGIDFEKLINNIFDQEDKLLHHSYHTDDNRSEQIDGAIEIFHRIFLLEVKWVAKDLAASELFAFIGKIENKFAGTLGVFISRNELSVNFIRALNRGRRQSVIIIHGKDIDHLFTQQINLHEYLEQALKLLSYNNLTHYPVEDYVKRKASPTKTKPITASTNTVDFINKILSGNMSNQQVQASLLSLSEEERDYVYSYLLKQYSNLYYATFRSKEPDSRNSVYAFLSTYRPSDSTLLQSLAETYYNELLRKSFSLYSTRLFSGVFEEYFTRLNPDTKKRFERFLIKHFEDKFGSYHDENSLTDLIRLLWDNLSTDTKEKLAAFYLDIFISDRKDSFAQKQFAAELLNKEKISKDTIKKWLRERVHKSARAYDHIDAAAIQYIAYTYRLIAPYLGIPIQEWEQFIDKLINRRKA